MYKCTVCIDFDMIPDHLTKRRWGYKKGYKKVFNIEEEGGYHGKLRP